MHVLLWSRTGSLLVPLFSPLVYRQGVAAWGIRRRGPHTLSLSKLSCIARAGISCNSLTDAETCGGGGGDAELASSLPKSGRNNECRGQREFSFREGEGGGGGSICTLQACAAFWPYTKAGLHTKRKCLSVCLFQGPNCCRYVKVASVCCCRRASTASFSTAKTTNL